MPAPVPLRSEALYKLPTHSNQLQHVTESTEDLKQKEARRKAEGTLWIHTEWTESLDRWFMSKSVNKDDSRVSDSSCFTQLKNQVGIAYCPKKKKRLLSNHCYVIQ